jgi:crossover junction endodeoxyribonuclease RusA
LLPLEFIVEGTPVSLQSHNRKILQAWKQKVRIAAQPLWGNTAPVTFRVQVTLTYFYRAEATDVDNIIKPILDALNDLVYKDDKQVTDIYARKRDLRVNFMVKNSSILLIEELNKAVEFVHIVVTLAPNPARI